jgi:hypothetical protein
VNATLFSISGDWTEVIPGVCVRILNAPNQEDMEEHYASTIVDGIVILQVQLVPSTVRTADAAPQDRLREDTRACQNRPIESRRP